MAEFLTPAWIAELATAAAEATAPLELRLTVQQVVADHEGAAEVAYALRVHDGRIAVTAGRVVDADVTFTQDRATAAAIARGELTAQAAFLRGRLRVGGDLSRVLADARAVAGMADVFAAVRAATSW